MHRLKGSIVRQPSENSFAHYGSNSCKEARGFLPGATGRWGRTPRPAIGTELSNRFRWISMVAFFRWQNRLILTPRIDAHMFADPKLQLERTSRTWNYFSHDPIPVGCFTVLRQ